MVNQCTKFEVSTALAFQRNFKGTKNLNGSSDHARLFQERFLISGLGLATISLLAKFEVSIFNYFEVMKRDEKCRNWSGLGVMGYPRSSAT